jgi:proteasome lid subunit RPN8/RPN11
MTQANMTLTMRQDVYDAVRRHGEQTYPNECCGILLGKTDDDSMYVKLVIQAGNTRTDSAHNRYHIAPQELIQAQRQAREFGLDIVGFYHSHPDHPPQWSPTDFAEAHWFGCAYVITAVEKGRAAVTNSFLLNGTSEDDKAFEDQTITIAEMAWPPAAAMTNAPTPLAKADES